MNPKFVLAAACACSFVHAANADVIFSDGTFTPSNWGFETPILGAGGTSSPSQVSTGNPGFARRLRNDVNSGGTVFGFSRYGTTNGTRYEPAVSGPIDIVDFSIDFRFISGIGGDGHAVMLGAKQGQVVYAASYAVTGSTGQWGTISATALTAADFAPVLGSGPAIDFSAAGAPLRFGFIVANSAPGSGYFNEVDYDNFHVRVAPVPAPGALALVGITALARPRRRR